LLVAIVKELDDEWEHSRCEDLLLFLWDRTLELLIVLLDPSQRVQLCQVRLVAERVLDVLHDVLHVQHLQKAQQAPLRLFNQRSLPLPELDQQLSEELPRALGELTPEPARQQLDDADRQDHHALVAVAEQQLEHCHDRLKALTRRARLELQSLNELLEKLDLILSLLALEQLLAPFLVVDLEDVNAAGQRVRPFLLLIRS